jgi:hypothetical protein
MARLLAVLAECQGETSSLLVLGHVTPQLKLKNMSDKKIILIGTGRRYS